MFNSSATLVDGPESEFYLRLTQVESWCQELILFLHLMVVCKVNSMPSFMHKYLCNSSAGAIQKLMFTKTLLMRVVQEASKTWGVCEKSLTRTTSCEHQISPNTSTNHVYLTSQGRSYALQTWVLLQQIMDTLNCVKIILSTTYVFTWLKRVEVLITSKMCQLRFQTAAGTRLCNMPLSKTAPNCHCGSK